MAPAPVCLGQAAASYGDGGKSCWQSMPMLVSWLAEKLGREFLVSHSKRQDSQSGKFAQEMSVARKQANIL